MTPAAANSGVQISSSDITSGPVPPDSDQEFVPVLNVREGRDLDLDLWVRRLEFGERFVVGVLDVLVGAAGPRPRS